MEPTGWDDDNDEQNDDTDNDANAHLHVLPPHSFADAVGATAEALSTCRKVVGLILKRIEPCATLADLVDVVTHNADSGIDFLKTIMSV